MKRLMQRWLWIGAVLLAGALLLLLADRSGRLLFRVIGLLGTAMFAFSILAMLLTFRKARRLSPPMLVLAALLSLAGTLLFYAFAGSPVGGAVIGAAVILGLLLGFGWSLSNLLFIDGEAIQARGTLWSLAIWAVSIAFPQFLGILGLRTPALAAALSFFSLGLSVGNSLGLIGRYAGARRLLLRRQGGRA